MRLVEAPVFRSVESRGGKLWNTDDPVLFHSAEKINGLKSDPDYIVGDCRGFPEAVSLPSLARAFERADTNVAVKSGPAMVEQLKNWAAAQDSVSFISVFISPVSLAEITDLIKAHISLEQALTVQMLQKQLARARFFGRKINDAAGMDFLARASCLNELRSAHLFTGVLSNGDGEGHLNWHQSSDGTFTGRPEGDAGRLYDRFTVAIFDGMNNLDTWPKDLGDES